jgi:hypothetical protein
MLFLVCVQSYMALFIFVAFVPLLLHCLMTRHTLFFVKVAVLMNSVLCHTDCVLGKMV